jgi:EAL domain-containing protein (putative c-di-GMP-specific phosphodiesterase class I)
MWTNDFGSGYSSLIQLLRLPFSEIKVDKPLVL